MEPQRIVPVFRSPLKLQILPWALACYMAAAASATESPGPQIAEANAAKRVLLELEKEWADAEDRGDATVMRRILDQRFVATIGVATYDREAFIKLFSGGVDPTASHSLTYQAVIIDGDTAVLVGTDTARSTREGEVHTTTYRYTTTYIRRGGRWRALAEHVVKVPEAK